ncbi:MAG: adenylate/guanylate cyclase domain-containing protein [Alphaproteobacteria bacterium]|nr:adenylate/guanylate cyclase domain-containing protein [Alphaproteobacteria bacterium]
MTVPDDPGLARLLDEAAVRAEATIARLRVVTALVFGGALVVFALAPTVIGRAAAPRWQMLTAAVTLVGYLAVAVASLRLSVPGRFRSWMSFVFVGLDASLLGGGLVAGYLQSGLPSSFGAVFPAIWLAPLVLAFGTLRYDVRVQVFALVAILAAIAVAAMCAPMHVEGAPLDSVIPLLGVPPALVRLTILAMAGIVLVIAVRRSRNLLLRAITETRARSNLTRFLPRQVVEAIAAAGDETLRRGRRQRAAILFIDIRGFTRRSELLAPDAIGPFLGEFRQRVTREIEARGGLIEKFLGDGILAVFGVPQVRGDDPARALDAARAVLAEIARWPAEIGGERSPVAVGIGAHFGEVFAGTIGDETRLEFTVIGDTVNVAARLQEMTKEHGTTILASTAIVEAAGESGHARWLRLPPHPIRGREAPIDLFALAA